jgi:hypothetical protein
MRPEDDRPSGLRSVACTLDFPRCFQVATIVCHSNCRADKMDLCLPEWVYEKIQAAGIRLQS